MALAAMIAHMVALEGMGGVERYLSDLVHVQNAETAAIDTENQSAEQIVLHRRGIHPLIMPAVDGSVPIYCRKRWGPFTLPRKPRWIRRKRLQALLGSHGKGLCLIWNDNTDIDAVRAARAAGWASTYWERGSGWHACMDEGAANSLLQEADHLIANSYAGRRILELRWGVRRPIEVLRNGVRPSVLPRELRPRSRPEGPARIGVAGRLTAVKGPAVALHAARVLADSGLPFTLEFAGTGPLEGDLRRLAGRLALGERVVFHGALADMNAFYQDMHLLLHTALREPCANVVPEAHAHGLPCLATLIDGMPELLPEGSHKLLLKPNEDLDAYQELGASGGAMDPWV